VEILGQLLHLSGKKFSVSAGVTKLERSAGLTSHHHEEDNNTDRTEMKA
jgi:hypothetical protein